jgi:hypothetical protein
VPVPHEPLKPVAAEAPSPLPNHERRKRHQVVRFERRTPAHAGPAEQPHESHPVRELKPGRRKNHVIVRFGAPQGHEPHPEPGAAEWQLFDQVEA